MSWCWGSVADPGIPTGEGGGGANLLFGRSIIFAQNCMKMKRINWNIMGTSLAPPRSANGHVIDPSRCKLIKHGGVGQLLTIN